MHADATPREAPLDATGVALMMGAIATRRSVRTYTDADVSDRTLRVLLDAAMSAPSPHNRQPWRFAVLATPEIKRQLAEAMAAKLRQDRHRDGAPGEDIEADAARSIARISGAPAAVLVALSMAEMDRYDDLDRGRAERLMAVQATAAAIQNLLLAAHGMGLGAAWMCAPLFCPATVRQALDLPPDWQPQALITLGMADKPGRPRPRKPFAESVKWIGRAIDTSTA